MRRILLQEVDANFYKHNLNFFPLYKELNFLKVRDNIYLHLKYVK